MTAHRPQTLFVAMPFRAQYDRVLDTVKEAAALLNMRVVQVGEEPFAGSIISYIRSSIDLADLMVAIVSEENGNVYYEIGLAHCRQKPVVLLTSDPKAMKFDLRDHRAIVYDPSAPGKIRDDLVRTLESALDSATDPQRYFADTFAGASADPKTAADIGQKKAIQTIKRQGDLQDPVKVKQISVLASGEVAVEVEDFLGVCVRAVFDVNGILKTLKRM